MSLTLANIKKNKGTLQERKRVGRGNGSGHGTYSCKGLKGQNSRSGVSGLKRLGMKQVLLRTPKKRGFKSLKAKAEAINLALLNENFKDGDKVSPQVLFKKRLVDKTERVKILGNGELKLKNLIFEKLEISLSAKEQIEKLGGKIS